MKQERLDRDRRKSMREAGKPALYRLRLASGEASRKGSRKMQTWD